jgi:hypothetical protein
LNGNAKDSIYIGIERLSRTGKDWHTSHGLLNVTVFVIREMKTCNRLKLGQYKIQEFYLLGYNVG